MNAVSAIEQIAAGGDIPRAWWGRYWRGCFGAACATFGIGAEEAKAKGYRLLEIAFAYYPKWKAIPDGEALELGAPMMFGDIRFVKGSSYVVLPHGGKAVIDDGAFLNLDLATMVYGMTAPRGWEWFNPVRNDARFKECVETAKKLLEE